MHRRRRGVVWASGVSRDPLSLVYLAALLIRRHQQSRSTGRLPNPVAKSRTPYTSAYLSHLQIVHSYTRRVEQASTVSCDIAHRRQFVQLAVVPSHVFHDIPGTTSSARFFFSKLARLSESVDTWRRDTLRTSNAWDE